MKITKVKAPSSFEYYLTEYELKRGKRKGKKGYGFPNGLSRWCTGTMKTNPINKYLKEKYKGDKIVQYIGIAVDEKERCKEGTSNRYPLVEWGVTESNALQYCYNKGYDWNGLYEKFDRLSCWMCPLQKLSELKVIYKEFPELWKQLSDMNDKVEYKFRQEYIGQPSRIREFEVRFDLEDERIASGKSIRNKEFYNELRSRIKGIEQW